MTEPTSRDTTDRVSAWVFGLTLVYVGLYALAVFLWIFS